MQDVSSDSTAVDRAGRIETRGIGFIAADERHGRPFELFWVWFSSNLAYLYILFGGILILSGLTILQAIVLILVGNLFYIIVGVIATAGPTYGTATANITRLMFGARANKGLAGVPSWALAVAFEAIDLSICIFAGLALLNIVGIHSDTPVKVAVFIVVGVVTFSVGILGHATIVRVTQMVAGVLVVAVLILFFFTMTHANFAYQPMHPLSGLAAFGAICLGLTLIVSGPLTWVNAPAEYARYLPNDTSRRAVVLWTSLGGWIASSFLAIIGVLAGTVVNMSDPETAMRSIMPGWFYPVFLILIIVGTVLNNVLGIYVSGLALQIVGIPWRRSRTVFIDCLIGGALTVYAVFVSNFLTTLSNFLTILEVWFAPFAGVFVAHLILTRRVGRAAIAYDDARAEIVSAPAVVWRGVIALLVGLGFAIPCANTTYWQGPISDALKGADLAPYVGFVVAAVTYAVAHRVMHRVSSASPIE